MLLEIITPEKKVFSNQVDQVTLPSSTGEITVLAHHVPLLTEINPGEITIKTGGKVDHLVSGKGFAEITGEKVSVLIDLAETESSLDEKKIEEAKARAEEALKQKHALSEEEYAAAAAALQNTLAQLRFVRRHHSHSKNVGESEP